MRYDQPFLCSLFNYFRDMDHESEANYSYHFIITLQWF